VTIPKRLAAAVLSTSIIAAPVLSTSTADAAPAAKRSWTTIGTMTGAKQQACQVTIRNGKALKIYSRLVNGRRAEVGAGMNVLKNGEVTKQTWRSEIMGKGKTSPVGSVVLPLDDKYTLEAFRFQGQMGDGGLVKVKKIGAC
jgi:hypothetical protein